MDKPPRIVTRTSGAKLPILADLASILSVFPMRTTSILLQKRRYAVPL